MLSVLPLLRLPLLLKGTYSNLHHDTSHVLVVANTGQSPSVAEPPIVRSSEPSILVEHFFDRSSTPRDHLKQDSPFAVRQSQHFRPYNRTSKVTIGVIMVESRCDKRVGTSAERGIGAQKRQHSMILAQYISCEPPIEYTYHYLPSLCITLAGGPCLAAGISIPAPLSFGARAQQPQRALCGRRCTPDQVTKIRLLAPLVPRWGRAV